MASLPLLVCVILCTYYSLAHGGNEHGFVAVPTIASEPEAVCSTSRVKLDPGSNTVSVPLVHRHGTCAPTQSSDKPSFSERLRRSRARSKYIMSRVSKGMVGTTRDDANVSIPTHLGGSVDSLEYVVTVGLGTPPVSQVLLMDTGSDLSWVQCKPCNSTTCYPQNDPLFDPSKSSTYAPVPCNTDACRNLTGDGYGGNCTSDGGAQCGFAIRYGDGSQTTGVYSNEALTLAPGVAVKDFHFGCGHDQSGNNEMYDGLLSLGGAPESLVVQTSSVYGGAFSYCLPALNNQAGFLSLGAPSGGGVNASSFVFTPMIQEQKTYYVVNMTGITVGGESIDVPQSAFSGGMIIDSGTVVTQLQHTAYSALKVVFRKAMAAYPLVPNGELDTCYNFTGYNNVTVPRVALTFSGGATIDLDVPNGILSDDCLAFLESGPDDQPGILGNVNQRTLEVLYDVGRGRVGFRAAAC